MRAAESSLPAPVPAVLVPLGGGPSILLDRQRMQFGRSAACDIPWDHQGVSSTHCEFCFEGNWWKVTDLGSKNGVQINGIDVTSRMLLPGDRLTIARKYHFRIEDPNAEPASVEFPPLLDVDPRPFAVHHPRRPPGLVAFVTEGQDQRPGLWVPIDRSSVCSLGPANQ